MHKPQLIAHRGYAARYPENSLPALQAAVDLGARWLEFDVQLSSDRQPVLLHDADLMRTGGDPRAVFESTAQTLTTLSIGEVTRFGARFRDVTVPTLDQVCRWLQGQPQVQACVEIKSESIQHFGIEAVFEAVEPVLAPLRDQVVLISYDDAFLFSARMAAPQRIGWVAATWDEATRRRATQLGPAMLFTNWTRLPSPSEPLWPGPWQWAVYEVTDVEQALSLAARGIHYLETMDIARLLVDPRLTPGRAHD